MRIFCFLAMLAVVKLLWQPVLETYTLTLKQAIDLGLSRNPDVTLAKLDQIRAAQGVPLAQDPFYPHVGAGSGLAYNNGMPLSIEGSAPSVIQARASEELFNRPQHWAIEQQRETAKKRYSSASIAQKTR